MRNEGISIAKGLAIVLMVLGHARWPDFLNHYFGLMRMPLFFFFSGYCFKENYLEAPYKYLKKRITGIYMPYIKWALLFLLLHNIFYNINIYNDTYGFNGIVSYEYNIHDYLKHIIKIIFALRGHESLLGGYWFLHSLFFGSIIFYVTMQYIKNDRNRFLFLLLITIILSLLNISLPFWNINSRTFFAACFIMVGHLYRKKNFNIEYNNYFVYSGLIFILIGTILWPTSMLSYKWRQIIPYGITAITGTLIIFRLSKAISVRTEGLKIKTELVYIGNHTFDILTLHFLCFKLVSLLIINIYQLPIQRLAEFPVIEEYAHKGWWIVYGIVGCILPIIYSHLIDKLKNEKK